MGGLAGHMSHLYDNPSLTFGEIKDIFQKAANGELQGAEKTDGQNLYISFSVRSGKAKAARNKSNIKEGGLTPEQLAQKFEGRGALKEAFVDAFSAFELAAKGMPLETQIDIFGPDANIFYNAEIQDPRTSNVINYGAKTLTIHREGHAEFDKTTGSVVDRDLTQQLKKLEDSLKNAENKLNTTEYKVITKSVMQLKALDDKKPLIAAINSLNKLQKETKINDSDPIAQFLINQFDVIINKQFPSLSIETKKELLKRLMKSKGSTIVTVAKTISKELQPSILPQIKEFIANETELYKLAIAPLENIIHDFAVEMLKSLESAFVLDNKAEIKRLRIELTKAKNAIEQSADESAMEILKKQFEKIKSIENISTAAEGFVFSYNGETYKFTGNFAPLNQILGLFKYGRGGKAPLQQAVVKELNSDLNLKEQQRKSSAAVVVWGRFNPPTVGHEAHFTQAKKLADKIGADLFIIPTRSSGDEKNPLKPEEKIHYLNLMFPDFANNIIDDQTIKTIFNAANYINKLGYKTFKIVAGEDRMEDLQIIKKYNNPPPDKAVAGADFYFDDVEIVETGARTKGISGSDMRAAAVEGDLNKFMKGIAGSLDLVQAKQLLNLIRTRMPQKTSKRGVYNYLPPIEEKLFQEFIVKSGNKWCLKSKSKTKTGKRKNLGCYPSRGGAEKREKQVQYFKHLKEEELEEMSAAAAGSASGYSGPIVKKNEDITGWTQPDGSAYVGGVGISGGSKDAAKRDDVFNVTDGFGLDELNIIGEDEIMDEKYMIDRAEFIEELKLRKLVREAINNKIKNKQQSILNEETKLRQIIRKLLREGEEDTPHASTGINVLAGLLKKIVPIIEDDYKDLTTDISQRKSFRAHILNAIKNSLAPERAMDASDEKKKLEPSQSLKEVDVQVDMNDQATSPESEKFIDIGRKNKSSEEEQDTFTIPGEDATGRNMALKCFDKIEKNISDSYSMLSDKKDQDIFYDYLITNVKLYFDRFEEEITSAPIEEPQSSTYEQEKQKAEQDAIPTAADNIAGTEPVAGEPETAAAV